MKDMKFGAPATFSMMPRWTAMLNEDCLNVRLGDHFHQRGEATPDMQTYDAEPDDSAASDVVVEQGAE